MPYGEIGGIWSPLDSPNFYDVSSDLFTNSALSFGKGSVTILLSGLDDGHGGIPSTPGIPGNKSRDEDPWRSHFSIGLDNDPGIPDVGGWFDENRYPLTFRATANPVPEPGTFVLVFGGLLAMGLRSRRRG